MYDKLTNKITLSMCVIGLLTMYSGGVISDHVKKKIDEVYKKTPELTRIDEISDEVYELKHSSIDNLSKIVEDPSSIAHYHNILREYRALNSEEQVRISLNEIKQHEKKEIYFPILACVGIGLAYAGAMFNIMNRID